MLDNTQPICTKVEFDFFNNNSIGKIIVGIIIISIIAQ